MQDQADLGPQLAHEQAVPDPGLQAALVGAEHVGDHKGVTDVGVGAAFAVAQTAALDQARRKDKQLVIAAAPEEIHQQVMGGLQSDPALARRDAKAGAGGFQVQEPLGAVIESDLSDQGSTRVEENGVVLLLAPINPEIYLHGVLLQPRAETPATLRGRFRGPVTALEAQHAFDGVALRPGGQSSPGARSAGKVWSLVPGRRRRGRRVTGHPCSTPSCFQRPVYSNRGGYLRTRPWTFIPLRAAPHLGLRFRTMHGGIVTSGEGVRG